LVEAGALVVLAVLSLLLRDLGRGAALTSILIVMSFSFGPVARALGDSSLDLKRSITAAIWVVLILGLAVLVVRLKPPVIAGLAQVLTLMAGALVVMNVVSLISYEATFEEVEAPPVPPELAHVIDEVGPDQRRPDIYYLIFDRYGARGPLRDLFGFDNSPFLDALEDKGFFVSDETRANYGKTNLSLASSLNMQYLDFLTRQYGRNTGRGAPLKDLLQRSKVAKVLRGLDYRYIHMQSGFTVTSSSPIADRNLAFDSTTPEFSTGLYNMTVFKQLLGDAVPNPVQGKLKRHYDRVRWQFDTLEEMPQLPGPKFVFAHFLMPHPPFVFDRDGNFVEEQPPPDAEDEEYLVQVRYTNKRLLALVDKLLSGPVNERPIIILQSDEGPHPTRYRVGQETFDWTNATDEELVEKFSLLNAYHLPGGSEGLYEGITPVNTFRLIFDRFFGADLPLLPDRNFQYRSKSKLYDFFEITDRIRSPRYEGPPGSAELAHSLSRPA
jgi:hypothetical protein